MISVPTGDYLIEFYNDKGALVGFDVKPTCVQADELVSGVSLQPGYSWRILRCLSNSADKVNERWE